MNQKVLISTPQSNTIVRLRESLRQLGFHYISETASHTAALRRALVDDVDYVFFQNETCELAPIDLVEQLSANRKECGLIGLSSEIAVDEVFELLKAGARGILLSPFSVNSVEQTVKYAEKEIKTAESFDGRSDALTEVILKNFNIVSRLQAVSLNAPDDRELRELIETRMNALRRLVTVARGANPEEEELYLRLISEKCLRDAREPLTRLGALRESLREKRKI